jgi:hypothetical protein
MASSLEKAREIKEVGSLKKMANFLLNALAYHYI